MQLDISMSTAFSKPKSTLKFGKVFIEEGTYLFISIFVKYYWHIFLNADWSVIIFRVLWTIFKNWGNTANSKTDAKLPSLTEASTEAGAGGVL